MLKKLRSKLLKRPNHLIRIALLSPYAMISLLCQADSVIIEMPLYDQTDPSIGRDWLPDGSAASLLCAPTATAMVLTALVNRSVSVKGWTAASFAERPWQERIINTAKILNTDPRVGTVTINTIENLQKRRNELVLQESNPQTYPTGNIGVNYGNHAFNSQTLIDVVNGHKVGVISYGHYQRNTKFGWGYISVAFERSGAHSVALRGRQGKDLLINDPWKGVLYQIPLKEYSSKNISGGIHDYFAVTIALPNTKNAQVYLDQYASPDHYAFIETYSTLSYR